MGTLEHVPEGGVYVIACDGTGFLEEAAQLLCESFALCSGDYLVSFEIAFVAHDHNYHILNCVLPNTFDPSPHALKGGFFGYVVHHQGALGFSIVATVGREVRGGDGSVLFLSGWS